MKRSDMIILLKNHIAYKRQEDDSSEYLASEALKFLLRNGMLPPLSSCKLIKDSKRSGHKHSEVKHEWDEE